MIHLHHWSWLKLDSNTTKPRTKSEKAAPSSAEEGVIVMMIVTMTKSVVIAETKDAVVDATNVQW